MFSKSLRFFASCRRSFLCLALLELITLQSTSQVRTVTATDCSLARVQAAINSANPGDTVIIPAGFAAWTNGLTINKAIKLVGSGTNQTFISDAWTSALSSHSLIQVNNTHTDFVRISNFTISGDAARCIALISMGGGRATNVFRVDNMVFTNLAKAAIQPSGWSIGVVDHCAFLARPLSQATGVRVYGEGAYTWDVRPPSWGDINKVYVEDCSFSWSLNANGAVDSYGGARWAFRYNSVTNVNVGNHGTDSSGASRSTHSFEVYNNRFVNTTAGKTLFFSFRGGTGPIFSNIVHGYAYPTISLQNYRTTGTNIYKGTIPCCEPWGPIDGQNPLDGNIDASGWPAFDSIGRTSPTLYHTNKVAPNGIATRGYTVQGSQPLYAWKNTVDGTPILLAPGNVYENVGVYATISSATEIIREGRDFFNETVMPQYAPLKYPHPFTEGDSGAEPLQTPKGIKLIP